MLLLFFLSCIILFLKKTFVVHECDEDDIPALHHMPSSCVLLWLSFGAFVLLVSDSRFFPRT